MKEARTHDPIRSYAEVLGAAKVLEPGDLEKIEQCVKAEIDDAVAFAAASPMADPADLLTDVYA